MAKTHLLCNRIRRFKPDPPDIVRKFIRILLNHFDAFVSVSFVDLSRVGCADAMILEEQHDVLDFLLFCPSCLDPLHPHLSNTRYRKQPIRIRFNHIQCVLPEFLNDFLCEFRVDAFDQAGAKVLLNSKNCGWECFLKCLHGELPAVFRVDAPGSR